MRIRSAFAPLLLVTTLFPTADVLSAGTSSVTLPWPDLGRAAARSPGGGAKDAALLVAIERYPFLEDKPVTGAKRNLKDWQLYLTQTRGVPVENVTLLRDDQATREKILNAAAETAKRAQAGGTVWFLFIGHGAPSAGKKAGGVLLGVDTQNDADSLGARGVAQSELLSALGKGKHARTVAILDSCFSGRSSSGSTLVAGLQPIVATRIDAVVATGTVLLAAAQGNEYAGPLPGGNRPAFSYLTLAALRGWGDSNHDGKVTVSEATQYARRALQALLVGRHQTPDMAGPGDSVAVASAGESGPDLGDWQRMMADPSEATAPVSPTPAAGTRERASVHNEAPYANSIARVEHSASEASEVVCDVNNANGPQGCYQLGNNYNYGWNGVPEDCARAVAYYEKACASGIGQACSAIGFIFRDGKGGVAKDGRRAVAYFQRGCDAGIGNTCMALGQMFGAGGSIAKDEVRAAAIFGKTCNGGYVDACIELGEYYKDGKGVAMDRVRAAVIFERACDAGSSSGCQHLGQAYHYGHGVAPDESRAVFFLGKACDAGNRWSCQELGSRYTKGEGVVQDYARAAAWYRKGCEKGDKKACNLLNQLR